MLGVLIVVCLNRISCASDACVIRVASGGIDSSDRRGPQADINGGLPRSQEKTMLMCIHMYIYIYIYIYIFFDRVTGCS